MLFPHNLPRFFIISQPGKARMMRVPVRRPLCEVDLRYEPRGRLC
jgi:hypothetical protein